MKEILKLYVVVQHLDAPDSNASCIFFDLVHVIWTKLVTPTNTSTTCCMYLYLHEILAELWYTFFYAGNNLCCAYPHIRPQCAEFTTAHQPNICKHASIMWQFLRQSSRTCSCVLLMKPLTINGGLHVVVTAHAWLDISVNTFINEHCIWEFHWGWFSRVRT